MAGVTSAPLTRLRAIALGTLDTSGLSSHAQGIAITAGDFHLASNGASLRDARYQEAAQGAWDRALSLRAIEGDDYEPRNEYDGYRLESARVELLVGFHDGMPAAHLVDDIGSETQAAAAADAESRAIDEASRLVHVLTVSELYQSAPATDPAIVLVTRAGPTRLERTGREGQLLTVTQLELALWVANASTHRP